MAWCGECWSDGRRTIPATKVLDAEDLCDLHYRKALGPGLALHAAPLHGAPPLPPAVVQRKPVAAPAETQPMKPALEAVDDKKSSAPPEAAKEKEHNMDEKNCGREGCGKKLTAANKSGFCTKHYYDSKRKSGADTTAGNGKEKAPRKIRGGAGVERRRGFSSHSAYGLSPAPWRAPGCAVGAAQPAGEGRQAVSG